MKETATQASIGLDNLKHALKITEMAIEKKTTIPVLQGVRMEQIPAGLAVEATDLEIAIRVVVPEIAGPQQPVVIPAEKLHAWAKLLEGDNVALSISDSKVTAKCGRAKATFPVIKSSNWPAVTYAAESYVTTLSESAFKRALSFADIAISREESRFTLNAALISGNGTEVTVVATDSHRMSVYTFPSDEKLDVLLPTSMIEALSVLLGDNVCGLATDTNQIFAKVGSVNVAAKKICGSFPQWKMVMPAGKRTELTVSVADLKNSLQRCRLLTDAKSAHAVDLVFTPGELALRGQDDTNGEADEVLSFTGSIDSKYHTRINSDYLIDFLAKLTGEVVVSLGEPNSALLFKAEPHDGERINYLIMPMRV